MKSISEQVLRCIGAVCVAAAVVSCGGGAATPVTPGCTAFTDSFNNPVTCAQMAALPSFDSGSGGGDGDAGGDGDGGDGAPIANTKLHFVDVNNHAIDTTTDANGYFRISLRGMKAPIIATVVRDNLPWRSMLVEQITPAPANRKFYTINLTALTDKISSDVAVAAGLSGPAQLTPAAVQNNLDKVQIAKDALNAQLAEKLVEAGLNPATFNALTQPFKPDLTGYDKVLENVVVVQNPGGTTQLQPKHSVGGSFSGSGNRVGLVLKNGTDSLSIANNSDTTFAMPVQVLPGTAYNLQIATQPSGATCAINNASGTMGSANVTSINIICNGVPYTLGGTVAGLGSASGLVLTSNGQDLTVPANSSSFTFATGLPAGTNYSVSVKTQPVGAICSVASGGSGSMPTANVSSVAVTCSSGSAKLGGSITGLTGSGLVLSAAGQTTNPAAGASNFSFANPVAYGTAYNVTVQTQPTGQSCVVNNGSGSMGVTDVTNVTVSCSVMSATLGGVVKNLNGSGLVLSSNGMNAAVSPSSVATVPKPDVPFAFASTLAGGTSYSVSVKTQPAGQTCTVGNGTGIMAGVAVNSVAVTCGPMPLYTLGGTATDNTSELVLSAGGQSVTVPGKFCVTSPCNSSFSFPTALAAGTAYNVTVQTQPAGQTCTVSNGSGNMPAANVNSVSVTCSTQAYMLGGSISTSSSLFGLVLANGTQTVAAPTLVCTSFCPTLTFAFPSGLPVGAAYNVTVQTQPAGLTCIVSNGSGSMPAANVNSVSVTCSSTQLYTLGGSISTPSSLSGLVLANGSQTVVAPTLACDGACPTLAFAFPNGLAVGTAYNVTVQTQPVGLTCSVTNGTGSIGNADVTNVMVDCSATTIASGAGHTPQTVGGIVVIPPTVVVASTSTVAATASSGLAVTFTSMTPSNCTVSGSTVTGLAVGTCTIAANQAGNGTYSAAPQKTVNLTVGRSPQTIGSVNFIASAVIVGATTTVSATASSGLPVTFTSMTPSNCTVSGSTVTGLAVGVCTIATNQAGNVNYLPATEVMVNFTIG